MTTPNPFRGLVDLMGQLERMRQLGKAGYDDRYEGPERTPANPWSPAADIYASGEDLVICVEVAGVPPDTIDITFSQGVLTIAGQRDTAPGADPAGEEVPYWRRERPHGAFQRSIGLPDHVTASDISADSHDGLLTVTVAGGCTSSAQPARRIPIRHPLA